MDMNKLRLILQSHKKWKVFFAILVVIVIAGTLLSLLARMTLIRDNVETRPRLAVVGPMGSPSGVALKQGAALYIEHINSMGGINGRQLELLLIEETPDAAAKVTADKRVIGIVGHLDAGIMQAAAPVYALAKLTLATPLFLNEPLLGIASLGIDPREEARFVANYARNIQQQRLMYVVRESGAEFDPMVDPFLDVYKRFDTPVQQVWTIEAGQEAQMKALFDELGQIDAGAIYIAARPELAARLVKGIRSSRNALEIFGPSQLATNSFADSLKAAVGNNAAIQSHGIMAATPMLFDTSNDETQRFLTQYQKKYGASPDWLATYAYDAAQIAVSGIAAVKGISGDLNFINGQAQLPIQMGIYNGDSLISAPVQLLPIAKGASFNYIDALRLGRVLFVNDRFMYKTNVVYVGFEINEISNIDPQKDTATLDMSIWFRYRGKFDPQDLQIVNAIEPVKLDTPEESKESDEVQYRRYRIKQQFHLNFTQDKRAYDHYVAGIAFRHRLLNRNNLTYVVDMLGMPTGNALLDDLQRRRVVKAGSGWAMDNAWVSQDLVRERGAGAPQYVGMTGEQALFSTITMGILLKPGTIAARDVIDGEYFIYLAIFGLLGVLAAIGLDTRNPVRHQAHHEKHVGGIRRHGGSMRNSSSGEKRGGGAPGKEEDAFNPGRYWSFQSWLLRLIFLPTFLLATGNLIIDWSFTHWPPTSTRNIVLLYDSLWWILVARLADMAVRRFIWTLLEERAGRKVPDVMKVMVTIIIFTLCLAGIIAVVFNQTLTSLLATSGVLVMVIGLAIQANIANIFSGIILNIERPFRVGDYIKINNVIGMVKDITWRTVRIESNDGPMVSLANSKVSEAFMENYSFAPHGIGAETMFYTPAAVDAKEVLKIITEAIANAKSIICKDDPMYEPSVRFKGVVNVNGQWVASYAAGYRVKILPKKAIAKEELWIYVSQRFMEQGIPLMPADNNAEIAIVPEREDRV